MLLNDGDQPLKLNSASLRLTHGTSMVPAGTNTYAFTYVGGTDFPAAFVSAGTTYSVGYNAGTQLMMMTMNTGNYNAGTAIALPIGGPAKKVGRFSLKITNTDWVAGATTGLAFNANGNGAVMYVNGSNFSTAMGQSTPSLLSISSPCVLTIPVSCSITSAVSNIVDVTCYGISTGEATVTLTNATAPVIWQLNGNTISGSGTSIALSSLNWGNNSVAFTDNTGCTGIATFAIGGPSLPMTVVGCTHTDAGCNSGAGTVTAGLIVNPVGAPVYSWTDSMNVVVSTDTAATLPPGTYTLTVTDNCSSTTCTQTILEVDSFATSFSSSSCDVYNLPWGGSVSVSGDYLHTYTTTAGCDSTVTAHVSILTGLFTSFSDSSATMYFLPWGDTATTSGDYVFTYTASNGCDSEVTAHITIIIGTGISEHELDAGNYYSVSGNAILLTDKISNAELFTDKGEKVRMNNLSPGVYFLRGIFNRKMMTFKVWVRN
jgi:hypothetical protein